MANLGHHFLTHPFFLFHPLRRMLLRDTDAPANPEVGGVAWNINSSAWSHTEKLDPSAASETLGLLTYDDFLLQFLTKRIF